MSAWKRLHGLQNEGAVNINTVLRTELCRGLSHNLVALCNDLRAGAQLGFFGQSGLLTRPPSRSSQSYALTAEPGGAQRQCCKLPLTKAAAVSR